MRAQLVRWREKIDLLAEKSHAAGRLVSFDTLLYIDELKALHALAQLRLDELTVADGVGRAELEIETATAFSQLASALNQRRSATKTLKPRAEAGD